MKNYFINQGNNMKIKFLGKLTIVQFWVLMARQEKYTTTNCNYQFLKIPGN